MSWWPDGTDLGTRLDWVAVDHWNTEQSHIHILVRGAPTTAGPRHQPGLHRLGIARPRQELVTQELGPRTELEIRRALEAEVMPSAGRGSIGRLPGSADEAEGVVDLAPGARRRDRSASSAIGRAATLERLGLAEPARARAMDVEAGAETTLRELGERGDIIKRMHQA